MKAVSLFAIVNLLTKIRTKNSFRKAILVVFYGEGKIGGKLSFSRVVRRYVSVAFLAGLDSIVGGTRSGLENKFNFSVFVSGFVVNLLLAAGLTWVGDALGVEIYQAAIVTFGMRIFVNLGYIRRDLLKQKSEPSVIESVISPIK